MYLIKIKTSNINDFLLKVNVGINSMLHSRLGILPILLLWLLLISTSFALEKQTIGWLESVTINDHELKLQAKIDTGATTSSIHAKTIKKFTRGGKKWIRFRVKNKRGEEILLEKKIQRYVKIKRKLMFPIKRPVIKLGICISNVYRVQEVNLADRKNFDYQMLIGRNYLKGFFLVDSEITYTSKPSCK